MGRAAMAAMRVMQTFLVLDWQETATGVEEREARTSSRFTGKALPRRPVPRRGRPFTNGR